MQYTISRRMTVEDIRYTFDERQAMEATAYLLGLNGGQMNYTKTIKLLYLSDREALSRGLGSITTDIYKSLDYGPVTSSIYDCIKYGNGKIWNQYIRRNGYTVELIDSPDFEMLSIGARKILKGIYDKFKDWDWDKVVEFCHGNLPEWENPHGSSTPISIESILDATVESEDLESIRESLLEDSAIQRNNYGMMHKGTADGDR